MTETNQPTSAKEIILKNATLGFGISAAMSTALIAGICLLFDKSDYKKAKIYIIAQEELASAASITAFNTAYDLVAYK